MAVNVVLRGLQPSLINYLHKTSISLQPNRSVARWLAPVRREFYKRKKELDLSLEPKKVIRRSAFVDWNYRAELFAFGARFKENFKEETLKVAFTHQSYIEQEEKQRKSLGLSEKEISMDLKDNQMLINIGETILKGYIKPFLRVGYPYLPEEGIIALEKYLLTTGVLAHVASNLGVKELLLSADYPPENATLADSFKAVIGALATDTTDEQSELFVQDFLITQLIGKNIIDLWPMVNPMGIVVDILKREKRGSPDVRLIRESGRNTIFSVFQVGIYSDKKLIGTGAGETLDIAQDDAARETLTRFFEINEKSPPLPFGIRGREIKVQTELNLKLDEWTKEKARNQLQTTVETKQTIKQ